MNIEFPTSEIPSIYRAVASSSLSCPLTADGRLHQSLDLYEAREQTRWWTRIDVAGPWYLAAPQMSFFLCESRTQLVKAIEFMEQAMDLDNSRFSVEAFLFISLFEPLAETTTSGILQSDSRIFAEGDEVRERLSFLRRLSRPELEDRLGSERFEDLKVRRWIDGYLEERFLPARVMDREIGLLRLTIQQMNEESPEHDEGYESAEAAEAFV